MVETDALSALIDNINKNIFNKLKINVDKPEEVCNTINMMKGLRAIESEFRNIMNEQIK